MLTKLARIGATALAVAGLGAAAPALAQQKGGALNVATIGEPNTLDPMVAAGDLLGMITQHFYETLYTFDKNWALTPLLAETLPQISDGGKVYTIPLRQGVTFHNGKAMTAQDVVASLKRWTELASRGKLVAGNIASIEAPGDKSVKITLKAPFAPLTALLAFNNSAAVIMPADKMENPIKDVIGTGPYQLKERKPDQYIQLTASTATSSVRASPTASAAPASSISTRSASYRCPTPTPASRARSPASSTSPT